MKKRVIQAADLFCGAGGTSTGLLSACQKLGFELDYIAINHWDVAIATHSANHPNARHMCASIDTVDPRIAVPGGRLDLLWASPECTFFSVARGGKPVTDQGRASAWLILRWAELLYIDTILIENVKEFRDWCPVGVNGRPMKSKKGETFRAFIQSLKSLGYRVEYKVLNAADYGAATTRERLFIQARRGRKPVSWPSPSHSKTGAGSLFGRTKKWRAAKEVIEWQTPSRSIFGRKKPLAPATMARIIAGLEKFGGKELEPFLVILRNNQDAKSIHGPVPAITTSGAHVGVAQPFILPHRMFDGMQVDSIEQPLRTIRATPHNCTALVELKSFIVGAGGPARTGDMVRSVEEPLHTVLTRNHKALVQPFLVPFFGERDGQIPRTHSLEEPLPTPTSHGAGGLVEPYLLTVNHGVGKEGVSGHKRRAHSIQEPVPTVTTSLGTGLVEPFVMKVTHTKARGGNIRSADSPLSTITTAKGGEHALVEPFLSKYYGAGEGVSSVQEPVPTVTTKDRFALVTPLIRQLEDGTQVALDIHFRMLKPSELARAMSFPDSYMFSGNREAIVKQIGNAVDASMSQALCEGVLA